MTGRQIVSDTGPLITLEKLPDGYQFIRKLYSTIIIPPTVLTELVQGQFEHAEAYLSHYGIIDIIEVVAAPGGNSLLELKALDLGEREAIQLSISRQLPLLIEEEAGRTAARKLGLRISGIAGQILLATRQGLIRAEEAEQKLRILYKARRINRTIYDGLLIAVRQKPS